MFRFIRQDSKKMLRPVYVLAVFLSLVQFVTAETAAQVVDNAVKRSRDSDVTLADIIAQVEKSAASAETDSDRRSLYTFLGSLTEQAGFYEVASRWYASAAGIAASPASGTQAMTSEQLVLSAVRASLSCGDYETAESYLTSIRSSRNEETAAYVRLYTVWAWLCRAETHDDLAEPLVLLESYASMPSMSQVRPAVYLTLWYLTGDDDWSRRISSDYPGSAEAAVSTGNAELLPSPFWYFLPRQKNVANVPAGSEANASVSVSGGSSSSGSPEESAVTGATSSGSDVIVCQQLGFFRNRENAERLAQRVRSAGFSPDISEEKRSSGTVYYVVTVPEDSSGSMGMRLKTAGFECYPVFAE